MGAKQVDLADSTAAPDELIAKVNWGTHPRLEPFDEF
jgi:hypothetical protein